MKAYTPTVLQVAVTVLALVVAGGLLATFPSTVTAAAWPAPLTETQLQQITGGMCEPGNSSALWTSVPMV